MSPQPKKSPDQRQRRNKPTHLQVVDGKGRPVVLEEPDAPKGLLKATRDAWAEFWRSPVANAADPVTDFPAIERLFRLRDERERSERIFRKERVVSGSQGQPVMNPLSSHIARLDAEIRQLEDRFGLTPKARAQLGIVLGGAKKSLDDLNRALEDEQ